MFEREPEAAMVVRGNETEVLSLLALLLLFWYKSTNAGAEGAPSARQCAGGAQFTCFTGALLVLYWCFSGTKVQVLRQKTHLARGGGCHGNGCRFVKC